MSLDPLKADQYDDIRYYQNYALTQAPIGNIRPMVEWEPMPALFMAVPTYLTGDIRQRSKYDRPNRRQQRDSCRGVAAHRGQRCETNMTNLMLNAGVSQEVIDTKVKFLNKPFDSVGQSILGRSRLLI